MADDLTPAGIDLPPRIDRVYPWLEAAWHHWQARVRDDVVPHAILLRGDPGIGKTHLALSMAARLLCDAAGAPCGQCDSCRFMQAGTHADFRFLQPAGDSKWIRIDQIRELIDTLNLTAQRGRYKVAILSPAEQLNTAAANALLKTLEEPSPDTVLFLVTARPAQLPATIRSRCQQVHLATPSREDALHWLGSQQAAAGLSAREQACLLDLAAGAPLTARALAAQDGLAVHRAAFEDFAALAKGRSRGPVAVAAGWAAEGLEAALVRLYGWVRDLIVLRQAGAAALDRGWVRNRELAEPLQGLADPLDLKALHGWLDRIRAARRLVNSTVAASTVVEDLLLDWVKVSAPHRR